MFCCPQNPGWEEALGKFADEVDYMELRRMRTRHRDKRNPLDVRPHAPQIEQLYLPGRITHIVCASKHDDTDWNGDDIKIIHSGLSRFDYDDVLVSSHMISDHFNAEMYKCLERYMKQASIRPGTVAPATSNEPRNVATSPRTSGIITSIAAASPTHHTAVPPVSTVPADEPNDEKRTSV